VSVADGKLGGARLISLGRSFFGLALLGLGAEHFVYGEFVTGRAPAWPDGIAGRLAWVYGSGAVVMLAGLAILGRRWGRPAALGVGALVFTWALVRQVPTVVADSLLAGSWTRAGKALTIVGGSLAVAATLPRMAGGNAKGWRRIANASDELVRLGRLSLAAFVILAGMQHFEFTEFVATLIPEWFPGDAIWWSRLAGVALICGGVGLLFSRTAALAGSLTGLMIFSWVWVVHLPRIHASVSDGIALFEALAFSGIALVVAGAVAERRGAGVRSDAEPRGF
jgi:uncharacterized membrane protein